MKSDSGILKVILGGLSAFVVLVVFIGIKTSDQWGTNKNFTSTQRDINIEMEKELNKFEYYSELVKIYPELRERIITLLAKENNVRLTKGAKDRIVQELTKIIDEYFYTRFSFATDETVYNFLQQNLEGMERYKVNYPEFCVKYFIGVPPITGIIPFSELKELSNIASKYKLNIIISSVKDPTAMKKMTDDEIMHLVQKGYKSLNADINNIVYLDSLGKLPSSKGCIVAIDFTRALLSLGVVNASMVAKNLLAGTKKKQ